MTGREIEQVLKDAGIENARRESELLIAACTGWTDATVRAEYDRQIPDGDGRLAYMLQKRAKRYPLQYLLGTWSFWRQEYEVSPDCLIPRADTETLVECAFKRLPRGARVLDLCTGSGCIAISLLCERADLTAVAVDLYENTLSVARRNAARNGVGEDRLRFVRADVLAEDFLDGLGTFDALLSNPPYIPTAELEGLQKEVTFEPRAALDGGEDGLVFYRRMLADDARAVLAPGGCWMFEIGYDQGEALCALSEQRGYDCQIVQDLGGQDRVAIVCPKHTLE